MEIRSTESWLNRFRKSIRSTGRDYNSMFKTVRNIQVSNSFSNWIVPRCFSGEPELAVIMLCVRFYTYNYVLTFYIYLQLLDIIKKH